MVSFSFMQRFCFCYFDMHTNNSLCQILLNNYIPIYVQLIRYLDAINNGLIQLELKNIGNRLLQKTIGNRERGQFLQLFCSLLLPHSKIKQKKDYRNFFIQKNIVQKYCPSLNLLVPEYNPTLFSLNGKMKI